MIGPEHYAKTLFPVLPAQVIQGFVHSDPVQPCIQTGIFPELSNGVINLDENLLGQVPGILNIIYKSETGIYHLILILPDQRHKCCFIAMLQVMN